MSYGAPLLFRPEDDKDSIEFWNNKISSRDNQVLLNGSGVIASPVFTESMDEIRMVCDYVQERWIAGDYKKYAERYQDPLTSAINDIDGKIGELIVYKSLLSYGMTSSCVDFKVYAPNDKRFSYDLIFKHRRIEIGLGVKTHTLSVCGSWPSWIFQQEDKTIFGSSQEDSCVLFVCVSVDRTRLRNEEPLQHLPKISFDYQCENGEWSRPEIHQVWGGTGRIMSCNWKSDLVMEKVFDSPRKENIARTKRAVYLSRLIQKGMVSSPIDCLKSKFKGWNR